MKETIANFHDDVFLLLHVRPEFIFFSFIFKIVNPCEVKIAIALICKRKQNPEGFLVAAGKGHHCANGLNKWRHH